MHSCCENGKVENKVKVVLGAQWGDEGKGKLVDLLAEHADVVARCQVTFPVLCFIPLICYFAITFLINTFSLYVISLDVTRNSCQFLLKKRYLLFIFLVDHSENEAEGKFDIAGSSTSEGIRFLWSCKGGGPLCYVRLG